MDDPLVIHSHKTANIPVRPHPRESRHVSPTLWPNAQPPQFTRMETATRETVRGEYVPADANQECPFQQGKMCLILW